MSQTYRSGVAAILGPPNAGKSTLLNQLLRQKIAIVSPKPQTTRNRIMGVMHGENYQIILLDTPGLHEAREEMNRRMIRAALEAVAEADVAVYLADASDPAAQKPARIEYQLTALAQAQCPVLLALNKIDLLPKEKLLPLGRALDRVLTWNYYMLPMWYMGEDRLARWDKFSVPAVRPVYSLGFDTWWYDVNKAARLPAERR